MSSSSGCELDYLPRLPKNKSVGIGCIGAGFIMADCHLVAYRQAGFNPVAIAARRQEQAQSVADRRGIAHVFTDYRELLKRTDIEIVDIAVPPDHQFDVIKDVVKHADHIRGVLAQKPLGVNFAEAREIVRLCREAGITLIVNQNMRYDQSVRACRSLIERGELGELVLGTIEMRAIPHWMPWQERQGWVTLRIMSIHHLDTLRYWFGDPVRVFASVRPDPRTKFAHEDGICLSILEFKNGLRAMICDDVWTGPAKEGAAAEIGIRWRVEGTRGLALGTIGWPSYPERTPSTLNYSTVASNSWHRPRWNEVWFPDAFVGPMSELMCALEERTEGQMSGEDNLKTMALVEACYQSVREHRAVEIREILDT